MPCTGIQRAIESTGADLIVIGSLWAAVAWKAGAGSVTSALGVARVPVLVVREVFSQQNGPREPFCWAGRAAYSIFAPRLLTMPFPLRVLGLEQGRELLRCHGQGSAPLGVDGGFTSAVSRSLLTSALGC